MSHTQLKLLETLAAAVYLVSKNSIDKPELYRSQLRQAKSDISALIDKAISETVQ